jgi:hypothetical protein
LPSPVISLLSLLLVGVVLLYWFLPTIEKITPGVVSYQAGAEDEEKHVKKKISRNIEWKPFRTLIAMAKVIAATATSDVAIPVPYITAPAPPCRP